MTARRRWGIAAVLVAAVVLAFLPVLSNGFVNWDDDLNLTDNPSYRGFSWPHLAWMATTVHGGHYQPLTWLSFAPEVKRVQPWLREAARLHGVDIELLKAVIAVESGFDPKAVSPRGAIGLMQITPVAADRYGTPAERQRAAAERLLDERINVLTGARMLADLTRRFGRIDIALAAWNAGEGTVRKHGGEMPPIPETQAHVHLVLELYWALLQENLERGAQRFNIQQAASAPDGPN